LEIAIGMRKTGSGGLVYSTEGGRMCPACRKPVPQCICGTQASTVLRGDGVARVSRETKGRGGKVVTIVRGVEADAATLAALGKQIRTLCGSGGTVKDGVIEVQGDHCERVIAFMKEAGWAVKRAGG
jgi:translation initiation factor 1